MQSFGIEMGKDEEGGSVVAGTARDFDTDYNGTWQEEGLHFPLLI